MAGESCECLVGMRLIQAVVVGNERGGISETIAAKVRLLEGLFLRYPDLPHGQETVRKRRREYLTSRGNPQSIVEEQEEGGCERIQHNKMSETMRNSPSAWISTHGNTCITFELVVQIWQ